VDKPQHKIPQGYGAQAEEDDAVEEAVQVLIPGDCEEDSAYAGAGLVVSCCFFALGFCAAACPHTLPHMELLLVDIMPNAVLRKSSLKLAQRTAEISTTLRLNMNLTTKRRPKLQLDLACR
jgi:hypothetical protein